MRCLWHIATLFIMLYVRHTLAEVQVSGFAQAGSAPGKLIIPGKGPFQAVSDWPE